MHGIYVILAWICSPYRHIAAIPCITCACVLVECTERFSGNLGCSYARRRPGSTEAKLRADLLKQLARAQTTRHQSHHRAIRTAIFSLSMHIFSDFVVLHMFHNTHKCNGGFITQRNIHATHIRPPAFGRKTLGGKSKTFIRQTCACVCSKAYIVNRCCVRCRAHHWEHVILCFKAARHIR